MYATHTTHNDVAITCVVALVLALQELERSCTWSSRPNARIMAKYADFADIVVEKVFAHTQHHPPQTTCLVCVAHVKHASSTHYICEKCKHVFCAGQEHDVGRRLLARRHHEVAPGKPLCVSGCGPQLEDGVHLDLVVLASHDPDVPLVCALHRERRSCGAQGWPQTHTHTHATCDHMCADV
jgi:hypothetical protein